MRRPKLRKTGKARKAGKRSALDELREVGGMDALEFLYSDLEQTVPFEDADETIAYSSGGRTSERVVSDLMGMPHAVIFNAEYSRTRDALRALHALSFFNQGSLTPEIQASVLPHPDGATVVIGGVLTVAQVDEITDSLLPGSDLFQLRFDPQDPVPERLTRRARSRIEFFELARESR